ncbi:MAG: hypothetical protein M1600_08380 [Firmicutes bacterium]|nr:hypothetical protein [Bacillota bacterium]
MATTTFPIDPPLVLDADLLSCFLHTNHLALLGKLYPQAVILDVVRSEIDKVPSLRSALGQVTQSGWFSLRSVDVPSDEAAEYAFLTRKKRLPSPLGHGEVAVMAWVRYNGGTVGSNNLRDVRTYCQDNNLRFMTIRAIVADAVLNRKNLSMVDAESFWAAMLTKGRRLPCQTAQEAVDYYSTGRGKHHSIWLD